jgi:ADP-ribose pyrophosphatase YjhB (NUDIX family)
MRHVTLLEELEAYRPWNDQEERDRAELLRRLRSGEALYTRDNAAGHLTASAWVVSPDRTQVLMAYHNLYDSWSWLGGHADGERDLLAVALREVGEESGVIHVRPLSEEIFSLEILTVDGHEKRGKYVPSHLHLNLTYLLEAREGDALSMKADENSGVAWFGLEEAVKASTEPWFKERVYGKLNEKLRRWRADRKIGTELVEK